MAQLTDQDYNAIRAEVWRPGYGKEELNALAGGLPSKAALRAGAQAIEDYMVSHFAEMKSDLDAALGRTTTNQGAQKIMAGYFSWKARTIQQGG